MTGDAKENDIEYHKSLKEEGRSFLEKGLRVDKYLFRPLGWLIVRAVIRTPVSPNQLTVLSFCLGMAAAVLFATGRPGNFTAGGIFIILSGVIDCADGMLARSKNLSTEYGGFLDISLDRILDFFLLSGIGLGLFRYTGRTLLLVLGLFAAGLNSLQNTLFYLAKGYTKNTKRGDRGEARSLLFLLILPASLFRRLDLIVYMMLVETALFVLLRPAYLYLLKKAAPKAS